MAKHLVLVGGGHAHLTTLAHLGEITARGHRVTLVSPSPYHYYSGMGPGLLSGIYAPEEVRFHIHKLATDRGAVFLEDKVVRIDPDHGVLLLESGATLAYDVVSFNTGSDVPRMMEGGQDETIVPVKPVVNLYHARLRMLEAAKSGILRIVVLGGGAAGVEVSGNLARLTQDHRMEANIQLIAGSGILKGCPDRVRRLAMDSLGKRGVAVLEGVRAQSVRDGSVWLSSGEEVSFDLAFAATGVRPSPIFSDSGLQTGPDGGLLVDDRLRSIRYPELFGGGDCISLAGKPLAKVGVYAVRENAVLYSNLKAALDGGPLRSFDPGGDYLSVLNMGDGTGIFWKHGWVFEGKFAFWLKDYIDRRFMRRFQLSGERNER